MQEGSEMKGRSLHTRMMQEEKYKEIIIFPGPTTHGPAEILSRATRRPLYPSAVTSEQEIIKKLYLRSQMGISLFHVITPFLITH